LTGDLADVAAAVALLARCAPAERIRRAGSVDPGPAARWLVPHQAGDVAVAAVDRRGDVVGVANANVADVPTGRFEVAVIVAPEHRRRGVASALLLAAIGDLPAQAIVGGLVRADDPGGVGLLRHLAPDAAVVGAGESIEFTVRRDRPGGEAAHVA
jgi:GNAT superfamily N-acetyltransferase